MITPQPDTQDRTKQSEKPWKYYHGPECANGYQITLKDARSVSKTKSLLIGQKYHSIGLQQKRAVTGQVAVYRVSVTRQFV